MTSCGLIQTYRPFGETSPNCTPSRLTRQQAFYSFLASKYRFSQTFTLSVRDQVSHPYNIMDNIVLRAATWQNKDVHVLHHH